MTSVEEPFMITFVRDGHDGRSLEMSPDETILEATDDTEIDLRYGCRAGKCVSCTARLLQGDISYLKPPQALSSRQQESGFILLCVAQPDSDCRIEIGRGVLEDAFPQLWRNPSNLR